MRSTLIDGLSRILNTGIVMNGSTLNTMLLFIFCHLYFLIILNRSILHAQIYLLHIFLNGNLLFIWPYLHAHFMFLEDIGLMLNTNLVNISLRATNVDTPINLFE